MIIQYTKIKRAIIWVMIFLLALSILSTFYKYIVQKDFDYVAKPAEDFTDEDY